MLPKNEKLTAKQNIKEFVFVVACLLYPCYKRAK